MNLRVSVMGVMAVGLLVVLSPALEVRQVYVEGRQVVG